MGYRHGVEQPAAVCCPRGLASNHWGPGAWGEAGAGHARPWCCCWAAAAGAVVGTATVSPVLNGCTMNRKKPAAYGGGGTGCCRGARPPTAGCTRSREEAPAQRTSARPLLACNKVGDQVPRGEGGRHPGRQQHRPDVDAEHA